MGTPNPPDSNGNPVPPTPIRTYTYDADSADSNYSKNAWGRVTTETYTVPAISNWTDGVNDRNYTLTSDTIIELYSYNRAGQVTGKRMRITTSADDQGRTASDDVNATWSYDSEGRLASVIYPADANPQMPPQSYKYAYNGLGQLSGMTDSNNYDASLVSGVLYNPAGQLTQMNSTWFNETRQYNTLNQLTNITDKSGATTVTNITYNYPAAGQNNGKITSQTDAITGETVVYAYDSLSRLICAYGGPGIGTVSNCSAAPSGSAWGQGFQYDGFGNLTAKTPLVPNSPVPTLSVGIDAATNHMIGQAYDANGNMLSSPMGQALAYDAENRLTSTTSGSSRVRYAYDGQNKRIWSCQWDPDAQQCALDQYYQTTEKFYFYGPDGKLLATMGPTYFPASRGQNNQIVPPSLKMNGGGPAYFGGRMLGAEDRLGSHGRYYPYGEDRDSDLTQKNPGDGSFTFATYKRDSATGFDYADQRYYAAGWGRFASPDPFGGSAQPTNPASWNRYSYVDGDPANRLDPRGLLAEEAGYYYGIFLETWPSVRRVSYCWDQSYESGSGRVPKVTCMYQSGGLTAPKKHNQDLRDPESTDCDPDVIRAMRRAWAQSGNGATGAEATFVLVGTADDFTIVQVPFTNEQIKQTFDWPSGGFAIYHVHPNKGSAPPSGGDIDLANAKDVPIMTMSSQGLYEYDPETQKTTLLVPGLGWTKPCRDRFADQP